MDAIYNFTSLDTLDFHSLVNSITFVGNFDGFGLGEDALSTTKSCAFFNKVAHSVYVDVNHDGKIDAVHDLGATLVDVAALTSFNLIA